MNKKVVWPILLVLTIILAIVFSIGFFITINITTNSSSDNSLESSPIETTGIVIPDINSYNVLVLGDSIAVGSGDETGSGFENGFKELWEANSDKEITVDNLAVNGATSSDLLQVLQRTESNSVIEASETIIISIGGNEIKKLKDIETTILSNEFIDMKNVYTTNLEKILELIRNKNSECSIVFIGLYNPFSSQINPDKVRQLNTWNYETEQLLSYDPNSIFIPTYDLFVNNLDEYLTIDNFHPNSKGYKAISNRIFEVLKINTFD